MYSVLLFQMQDGVGTGLCEEFAWGLDHEEASWLASWLEEDASWDAPMVQVVKEEDLILI